MRGLAVLPSARRIRIVEREAPKIRSATEVKLRMLEVGVCGTDREIVAFHHGVPPRDRTQLILGHESLGEVVEVGPEVVGLEVGEWPDVVGSLITGSYRLGDYEEALRGRRGGIENVITLA